MRANTLNVHIKKHRSLKPFCCPVEGCAKRYTEKGNLMKHVKARHSGYEVVSKVGSSKVEAIRVRAPMHPEATKPGDSNLPAAGG